MDCSSRGVIEAIEGGSWNEFDDNFMLGRFNDLKRILNDGQEDQATKVRLNCILKRRPPKLVAIGERIASREHKPIHRTLCQQIRDKVERWSEEFRIPAALWKVWDVSLPLTKIGAKVPASALTNVEGLEEYEASQAVYILESGGEKSRLLMDYEHSMMKRMADFVYYGIRLYVCIEPEQGYDVRRRIEERVREDLPHFPYNP